MILALDRLFKVVMISGVATVAMIFLQGMSLPQNTPQAIKSHEGALKLLTAVFAGVVVAGGDKKQEQINVLNELKKKLATASPSEAVIISSEIRLLESKEVLNHVQESKEDRCQSSITSCSVQPLDSIDVSEPNARFIAVESNTLTELGELVNYYAKSEN